MRGLIFSLLAMFAAGAAYAQPAQPLSAWVQLVDGGVAEVRAVVSEGACPEASLDGSPRPMAVRAEPDAAAFPQTVCSLALPKSVRTVQVAEHRLPVPAARVDRILIMGDTGCRLQGLKIQDCNDPRAWPFALVVQRAAAEKPDLVIHVGDYYYRETACPPLYKGCVGSPHGDLWPSWQADFFDPARPLLDAAPWVFARGNHESCTRGWKGWFRLLDAGPSATACPAESPVFNVPIGGGVTLRVLDSADADDRVVKPGALEIVSHQLDTLPKNGAGADWIVTHRPFWGEVPVFKLGPFGVFNVGLNRTEQAAAKGKDLSAAAMVVSGHIHHFASFDFEGRRPAQLVVGTGGDVGEKFDPAKVHEDEVYIDGLQATSLTFQQYGYFIMDRGKGGTWTGLFKDFDGKPVARCTLTGRRLSCGKV
jgi:hypothetical protein